MHPVIPLGILRELDRTNTDAALKQVYNELGTDVQTSEYAGLGELADALNNGTCGAILLNKAYLDVIAEMDQYGSFPSQIREIASLKVATVVERNTPAAQQTSSADQEQTSSDTSAKDDAVTDEGYIHDFCQRY